MRWLGIPVRWRRTAAWWSVVGLLAACGGGGDGGTGPGGGGEQLAGDYLLVGANDDALPAVVSSVGCSPIQVQNGGLTMNADGHWQMQFNWLSTDGSPQFTGDHGRYRIVGDKLEFTSEAWNSTFEGELTDGLVWVYWDFCLDTPGEDLDLAFSR